MPKKKPFGRPPKAPQAESAVLESQAIELQLELSDARAENEQLRAHLVQARQLVERAASDCGLALQLRQTANTCGLDAIVLVEMASLRAELVCSSLPHRANSLLRYGSLQREFEMYQNKAPHLVACVKQLIFNLTDERHERGKATKTALAQRARARQLTIHFTVARLLHESSQDAHPLILIAVSLDSDFQHASRPLCDDAEALGTLMSRGSIQAYKHALIDYVPHTPFVRVTRVLFLLLDNIDTYRRRIFTRTESGERVKSHMEHGIVVEEYLVPQSIMAGSPPDPNGSLFDESRPWDIMSCLPTLCDITTKLTTVWQDHITAVRDGNALAIMARPPACMDQQPGRTWSRALPVQVDKHTNKGEDMAAAYQDLETLFPNVHKCCHLDYQTWILSFWLALRNPNLYKKWMFIGGELHRMMHSNDACVSTWWVHVVGPMAMLLGRNDIKQKFYANEFNNRDHFYRVVGVIIYKWLVEIEVPHDYLYFPELLLEKVKSNLPAWEIIGCCFYGCTFSLRDKFSMRMADSEWLDWSWVYTSVLARACNKTNYAKYGVFMDRLLKLCHPWVRNYFDKHRTYRNTDKPCTGVGAETAIEKVSNDELAAYLCMLGHGCDA